MVKGITIKGIATCLPSQKAYNTDLDWISEDLKTKLVNTVGINKRHIAEADQTLHFYAHAACEDVLMETGLDRNEIGFILLVSQTGDTRIPNTVIRLQTSLGLREQTLALEINMGCSGFVQGMYTAQSLLHFSDQSYGLVVCGDLSSKILEENDTGTVPLFSDGVSATLVEKSDNGSGAYTFGNSATNGDAIALKKNQEEKEFLRLDGHKILMLGLQSVVPDVQAFLQGQEQETIDFYFFHQASKIINQTIIRKLGLQADKCPETLSLYGNTSSATIPLTMSTVGQLKKHSNRILICGFGTGLSWATGILDLPPIEYLGIIER